MDESARAPLYMETAQVALGDRVPVAPRLAAEIVVAARRVLRDAIDRVLAAPDRSQMMAVLEDVHAEVYAAMQMVRVEVKFEDARDRGETLVRKILTRPDFLRALEERGVGEDVVERVRLGLMAADDEALLLRALPGGLDAHAELAAEDAKGRFLLMAIARWVDSTDPAPAVWDALTFEFLDTAGRAYGLASSIVCNQLEAVI